MTMWLYKCRACRILLGPGEDVMVGEHYYHPECAPDVDEAIAAFEAWVEAEVDRRLEDRHGV